jgi:hypothetical protein
MQIDGCGLLSSSFGTLEYEYDDHLEALLPVQVRIHDCTCPIMILEAATMVSKMVPGCSYA